MRIVVETDHAPPLDLVDDGDLRVGVPRLGLGVHPFDGVELFAVAAAGVAGVRSHGTRLPAPDRRSGVPLGGGFPDRYTSLTAGSHVALD